MGCKAHKSDNEILQLKKAAFVKEHNRINTEGLFTYLKAQLLRFPLSYHRTQL